MTVPPLPDPTRPSRWQLWLIGRVAGFHLSPRGVLAPESFEPAYVRVASVAVAFALAQMIPFSLLDGVAFRGQAAAPTRHLLDLGASVVMVLVDAYVALCCAGWFWIYFADRPTLQIVVRPGWLPFVGAAQEGVTLGQVRVHRAQQVLVALPLMLSAMTVYFALLLAQLGYIAHVVAQAFVLDAAASTATAAANATCTMWGGEPHRVFLSLIVFLFGIADASCLKLQPTNFVGAQFILLCWTLKIVFAAILLSTFIQFGTLVVRRSPPPAD